MHFQMPDALPYIAVLNAVCKVLVGEQSDNASILSVASPAAPPPPQATWNVHRALRSLLLKKEAIMDAYLCEKLLHNAQAPHTRLGNAYKQAKEAVRLAAAAAAAQMNPADAAEVWVAGQGKPPKPPSKPGAKAKPGAAAGAAGDRQQGAGASSSYSMWDLYKEYWWPFGEVLSAMESEGVRVDR